MGGSISCFLSLRSTFLTPPPWGSHVLRAVSSHRRAFQMRGWFEVSPAEDDLQSMAAAAAATAIPGTPGPSHPGGDVSNGGNATGQSNDSSSIGLAEQRKPHLGSATRDETDTDSVRSAGKTGHGKHGGSGDRGGNGGSGGGGMGALFLRLQLTLPEGEGVFTEEDKQASLALQTLLGEEDNTGQDEGRDYNDKSTRTPPSSGAARGGGFSGGGGDGGVDGEGAGDAAAVAAAVGGGGGAVARLLGMPMGLRNTVRDVQDTIGTVLDTLEVR